MTYCPYSKGNNCLLVCFQMAMLGKGDRQIFNKIRAFINNDRFVRGLPHIKKKATIPCTMTEVQ